MYPKGTFHDNVQRVERLCHSKRMHVCINAHTVDHGADSINVRTTLVCGEIQLKA
jgi:hypothetical protein